MALYFECRIKQKRTPLDCFLAILLTGLMMSWESCILLHDC